MSLNSGRTAQYKHNAQFLRHFCPLGDVNDAHRAGANRLQNKQTNYEHVFCFMFDEMSPCFSQSSCAHVPTSVVPHDDRQNGYGCFVPFKKIMVADLWFPLFSHFSLLLTFSFFLLASTISAHAISTQDM